MISENNLSEIRNNAEFYATMVVKLRERVSAITLMNLELESLLDLERQKTAMLEEQINLNNSATTK
jgi:hypothetical protein